MNNRPYLTLKEVSECLHVHPSTVRGWIKHEVLEAVLLPPKKRRARQQRRILQQTLLHLIGETNPLEKLLTPRQAADLLHVGRPLIRQWLHAGELPAVALPQVGRRRSYRIKRSTIDNLKNV